MLKTNRTSRKQVAPNTELQTLAQKENRAKFSLASMNASIEAEIATMISQIKYEQQLRKLGKKEN